MLSTCVGVCVCVGGGGCSRGGGGNGGEGWVTVYMSPLCMLNYPAGERGDKVAVQTTSNY